MLPMVRGPLFPFSSPLISLTLSMMLACAVSACSLSAGVGHAMKSLFSKDRPLALATFEGNRIPIAPGSRGTIGGYIPHGSDRALDGPRDAQFTYLIDFHVTRGLGRDVEGDGIRRVFFSPDGAHASFGDVATFGHGREIQTDKVRFSIDYRQEESRMDLLMRVYQSRTEPYQLDGRAIVAPPSEPRLFVGSYRENLGGWLFSSSPGSL